MGFQTGGKNGRFLSVTDVKSHFSPFIFLSLFIFLWGKCITTHGKVLNHLKLDLKLV